MGNFHPEDEQAGDCLIKILWRRNRFLENPAREVLIERLGVGDVAGVRNRKAHLDSFILGG